MLVLSRKEGESIVIAVDSSEPIVVTAVECRDGKCRLGTEARREFSVDRMEIYCAKQAEKSPVTGVE